MQKNNNGYKLLPSEPTEGEIVEAENKIEVGVFVSLPKDVLIIIGRHLREVTGDRNLRHFTMVCRRLYELREELIFHSLLQPIHIRSLNNDALGRGRYARGNGVLQALGVFPNGNILGADRLQLFIWSPDISELLHRIAPRRSHQIMHAAILPDNSIAVISYKQAGCCSKEKFCFDIYNPLRYRRQRPYALVLKYPHGEEELKQRYVLQVDFKGLPLQISWRRANEIHHVDGEIEFSERLRIWLEYQHNGLKKVCEINGESEIASVSYPNAVRECPAWPVARFPVRTHIQLTNTCLLGYHAVADNTPVRNREQNNMQSNCLIIWNSRDYLNERFRQEIREPVTQNNNNAPAPK